MEYILTKGHSKGVVQNTIVTFSVLDHQSEDPKMHDMVVLSYYTVYTDGTSSHFSQALCKQGARDVYRNLRREGYFQRI